jgi:CRP-like cAMP-binding protein
MYVVGAGEVHITRGGQPVNVIRRAEHFGELALLDGTPRSASAVAGDGVVLFELDSAAFVMALTGHPRAAQRVHGVADGRRER